MAEKIEDFGQKIGGARKDVWQSRNLEVSDLEGWTSIEREKYIVKKNVWKTPDYQKMVDDGTPKEVVFFIKLIRDNLPATPKKTSSTMRDSYQEGYIAFVSDVRDRAMQLSSIDEVERFISKLIQDYLYGDKEHYGYLTSKLIRTPDTSFRLQREINKKQFLYTEDEKALSNYAFFHYDGSNIEFNDNHIIFKHLGSKYYSYRNDEEFQKPENWQPDTYCILTGRNTVVGFNFSSAEDAKAFAIQREKKLAQSSKETEQKSRKKRFKPVQLDSIKRTGTDYRAEQNITGDDMLQAFGFYGGEFGNWENQNERQYNLNYSYDAFRDLAAALGVKDADISLGGNLSIAYGARGIGNALAHFEPARNVINLTKMKGAGSLAHEWGHAFDFFLAVQLGSGTHYATESHDSLIQPILDAMQWKQQPIEEVRAEHKQLAEIYREKYAKRVRYRAGYDKRSDSDKSLIDAAIQECIDTFDAEEQHKYMTNERSTMKVHSVMKKLQADLGEGFPYESSLTLLSSAHGYADENYPIQPKKINTDYYKDSAEMDRSYSKSDKGYWNSNVEMFARAFACYITDKLAPERSDYLCGHAETSIGIGRDGRTLYAYPRGEEREAINKAFDKLIETLKEKEILHTRGQEMEQKIEQDASAVEIGAAKPEQPAQVRSNTAESVDKNADRKQKLLAIAEKIGYDTAIQKLEQSIAKYQSALPQYHDTPEAVKQIQAEISFEQDVIAAFKLHRELEQAVQQTAQSIEKQSSQKTPEEIEHANTVNLPEFLMSQGIELKRVGKEYVMKEHDSVHIYNNAVGEKGKWYRFSADKGGDNIDFVREFFGKSFYEAVDMLNGGQAISRSYARPEPVRQPKQPEKHEITIQANDDSKRAIAFLTKTRGLDYNLVKELLQSGKMVQEARTGNVAFLIQDENGMTVGAEKIGTSTYQKYKGIETGSASGYGFEVVRGKGEHAMFFESTIDMLSYMQLHSSELDNHRLVSMMGVKPNIVEATMERYHIAPESVSLCSDNDKAGNEFAQRLQEKYPSMQRVVTEPLYKDWNDQLRRIPAEPQKSPVQHQSSPKMPIVTYGNAFWNTATDNRDKTLFQMRESDFLQHKDKLDQSGINYYAFARNGQVVAAVNDKETKVFQDLIGLEVGRDMQTRKSEKEHIPPKNNIIGNTEYRYIPKNPDLQTGHRHGIIEEK